jgi:hypothetical protein
MPASDAPVDVSEAPAASLLPKALSCLPEDAAKLILWLEGERNLACQPEGQWRPDNRIHWDNKPLDEWQLRLLHTHVFHQRLEGVEHVSLTNSMAARGHGSADGASVNLGVAMLSSAISSGYLPKLSLLALGGNQLEDADGQTLLLALRGSEAAATALATLRLNDNKLGDACAQLLSDGTLGALQTLEVASNAIGDEGAAALAHGSWPKLDRLLVQNNLFGDEAVEQLSASMATPDGALHRLTSVTLDSYQFRLPDLRNKETIVRIGGAPTKLDLAGVTDQGALREPMSNVDATLLSAMLSVRMRLDLT